MKRWWKSAALIAAWYGVIALGWVLLDWRAAALIFAEGGITALAIMEIGK